MKPEIGIKEKYLRLSIDSLTIILADEMTLYVKLRKFHWNVSGESFMELHKLFQSQYTELELSIDLIAERINKLGGKTIGTMSEFLNSTRLHESVGKYPSQKEMLKEILMDHETIIIGLRKDIEELNVKNKDVGTSDFITGLLEEHETNAWIIRRYIS